MNMELAERSNRRTEAGKYHPRGALARDGGVNFAIYSAYAEEVFLLLFDEDGGEPTDIIPIRHRTRNIWHIFVEGVCPGQLYAYRVRGPYRPGEGLRFNEHKLLLSPYTKSITRPIRDSDSLLFAYDTGSPYQDLILDTRDNMHLMPKSVVIDDRDFDWEGDLPPDIPYDELVVYEAHLKGFTAHPSSGVASPGTYLGLVEKIPYLKELGINAVEFLPLQQFYVEDFLLHNGLTDYWGYNTICFFAPEVTYGSGRYPGCEVVEFKTMVKELHRAGIEVIMDVVYNHTAEGNHLGPTISFKGIDNGSYYHLCGVPEHPYRYYLNYSGCGNSVRVADIGVLQLVMDSLRYWVEVMHVDGFRFDLASVLGRGHSGEFSRTSSFFDAVAQDPVLSRVKLIAEPWDLHTYQVGNFPLNWCEWNGRYRDSIRKFVLGWPAMISDAATRVAGSEDIYSRDGRSPYNSVNYITCHDGFTLNDLVSYNNKHNHANGENNNDGSNENFSWNCGHEGETTDPGILQLRQRMAKNFLCTLLFSSGTPMILAGDEFLRTQKGNNNAYCQDNELTWLDWSMAEKNREFLDFTKKLIAFVREHRIGRRRKFFRGCRRELRRVVCDITWHGLDLSEPQWNDPEARTLSFQLFDEEEEGHRLFFILNADSEAREVAVPDLEGHLAWFRVLDTWHNDGRDFLPAGQRDCIGPRSAYRAEARSTVVLAAEGCDRIGCSSGSRQC